ncbi:NADP(H)-dependent aldo-keto reductase [Methylophaga pinxianii]|uniref:NADP(H)-dependent aldo-keto reductase n=1 Tax=Methylophaga pinxianii TaxID=2881052 RepID=UPI001CF41D1B|nr:NADP(H)-dependent aldo-keto reductase [Methylophaga pinxianii]MCB2426187.1 NADP(H)-dependent aldo-keto reductase [Methylophaga pinxianii]UPH45056.1 NADP(H)-dependent aldo-keto reductase [Methylophaga pinxianii]
MQFNTLGNSDLTVSQICLGTMTYGEQNSQQEAFEQLDYAIAQGINFIDTAELYAIPPKAETYGATESIIGNWIAQRGRREDLVLASKIAGPGADWVGHIRQGKSRFDDKNISEALNNSLQRLQTDYLDLYQLHWPERQTNYFGKLGYQPDPAEAAMTPVIETLQALEKQVKAGKIRYIGLSNETPWGLMQFISVAKAMNLPVIASVQNPYSLLNRTFEIGCAEISYRENVPLLAYSPLGFGVLTGKYLQNDAPATARMSLWPHYARYSNSQAVKATQAYVDLAKQHRLDPAQMALAYVNSRPFVASTIIGATTMQQLQTNVASEQLILSDEVVSAIEDIHKTTPNPAP